MGEFDAMTEIRRIEPATTPIGFEPIDLPYSNTNHDWNEVR